MALLKSFKDKARLARQISFLDWLILIEAWGMLLFFHLALRCVSYETLKTSSRRMSSEISEPVRALLSAQKYQHLIGRASRLHLLPMTCLARSLALCWMLNRRGIPAEIRIGVKKSWDRILAHAWIEVLGEPIGEAEDIPDRFIALETPAG